MAGNEPLVSVLMPYYNGKKYVKEAIDSILAQTYKNIEIIVVDDASPNYEDRDYIISLTGELGIKLVGHEDNRGCAQAIVTAFENSSGEFIAELSQDDLYLPEKIEKQVEAMRTFELDAVYSPGGALYQADGSIELSDVAKVIKLSKAADFEDNCTLSNVFGASLQGLMVRRQVAADSLVEIWKSFLLDDWPVNTVLFTKYNTQFMDKCLVLHRQHDTNTSWNLWKWLGPKIEVPARLARKELKAEGVGRQIISTARRLLKQGNVEAAAALSLAALAIVESESEIGRAAKVLQRIARPVKKPVVNRVLEAVDNPTNSPNDIVCGWDELGKQVHQAVKEGGDLEKLGYVLSGLANSLQGEDRYKFALAGAVLSGKLQAGVPESFVRSKMKLIQGQNKFNLKDLFR